MINRPRQFGKTTLLYMLDRLLKTKENYFPIKISFEDMGSDSYKNEAAFIEAFMLQLQLLFKISGNREMQEFIESGFTLNSIPKLGNWFTDLVMKTERKVVLMIDEVDKSCNNRLFLDFLGMLRAKYLRRSEGKDITFHSVILAGVHDVKNLKSKIRPDSDQQFNSPWNIAADFDIDLNLSQDEISRMLTDYSNERSVTLDIPFFAKELHYFTSGYPFLVSYLCKSIDEKILPQKTTKELQKEDIEQSLQMALVKSNTNFESLTKNLANNPELYEFVFKVVMHDQEFTYNPLNETISQGIMYGILKEENRRVKIHNRLYEQMIYNYMISKLETSGQVKIDPVGNSYIESDGSLNIEKVIHKFQQFMKEQYSTKDATFIERNGRLLFLTFLKPIINGKGFDFKEVQISEEKRLDVAVTYGNQKYIIELKKWYGEKAHQRGLLQLANYLERQNLDKGYLIIYDSRKQNNQTGENKIETVNSKEILISWV